MDFHKAKYVVGKCEKSTHYFSFLVNKLKEVSTKLKHGQGTYVVTLSKIKMTKDNLDQQQHKNNKMMMFPAEIIRML